MNQFSAVILALCALSVSAGIVSPVKRCGGNGTPVQLRISGCEGTCTLIPGTKYDCEEDFFPSSASPSLSLKVTVCLVVGFCSEILDVELQGSSVQPGFLYTARYSIVPNDFLSGQTVEFRGLIYHTNNSFEEVCIAADVIIGSL